MLCDYKIILANVRTNAAVDAAGLRTHTTRVGNKTVSALVAAQLEAVRLAITRMQKEEKQRAGGAQKQPKIFTFHSSNAAAAEFSQLVKDVLGRAPLRAKSWHVFGRFGEETQPVDARAAMLRDEFAPCAHVAVVCSCKAVQEGVDVPCLDGVAFIDPKKSLVDIAQAMGRALRMFPGKSMAYIIVPVLMDEEDCAAMQQRCDATPAFMQCGDGGGGEAAVSESGASEAGEVMDEDAGDDSAAAAGDDDSASADGSESDESVPPKRKRKRAASSDEGRGARACFGTLLEILNGVMQCDERLEADVSELRAALAGMQTAASPAARVKAAQRLRDAEARLAEHVLVAGEEGPVPLAAVRAGIFLTIQDWLADVWMERFGQLRAIADTGGDANISQGSTEHKQLGIWLHNQRKLHRSGKLSPERLAQLRSLPGLRGFDGAPVDRVGWNERFTQLEAIVRTGGDANIPEGSTEHKQLGKWLSHQRSWHRSGRLLPERLAQLRTVRGLRGFDGAHVERVERVGWDDRFTQLEAIVRTGGDANIPLRSTEHKQLGNWLRRQRSLHRSGKLLPERLAKLRSVTGLDGFDDGDVSGFDDE